MKLSKIALVVLFSLWLISSPAAISQSLTVQGTAQTFQTTCFGICWGTNCTSVTSQGAMTLGGQWQGCTRIHRTGRGQIPLDAISGTVQDPVIVIPVRSLSPASSSRCARMTISTSAGILDQGIFCTDQALSPIRIPLGETLQSHIDSGASSISIAASNPEFDVPDNCGCTGSEANNLSLGAPQLELITVPLKSLWIPQFGHGTGGGNQLTSEIRILNLSTDTSEVLISSFDGVGNPADLIDDGGSSASEVEMVLAAFGTARLNSMNQNSSDFDLGWIQLQVPDTQQIGVEVLFNIIDSTGSLSSTNVQTDPLTEAASFLGLVRQDMRSGMALINPPDNEEAEIDILLFDSEGQRLNETRITLAPGHKISQFLDEYFEDEELQGFDGSVEVRSSRPIAILALRQEGTVVTTQTIFPSRQIE